MQKKSLVNNAEFFVAIGIFLVAAILLWQILAIKVESSRIFPIFIFIVLLFSGSLQLLNVILRGEFKHKQSMHFEIRQWLFIFCLILTYPLYSLLGFYAALFLLIFGVTLITFSPRSKTTFFLAVSYAVLVVLLCYVCFQLILGLQTPVGVLV